MRCIAFPARRFCAQNFIVLMLPALATLLPGCSYLLPSFDNPLNQDIASPRIATVVESVKCAMRAFLNDRTKKVQGEVVRIRSERVSQCQVDTGEACACGEGKWPAVKKISSNGAVKKTYECVGAPNPLSLDTSRFALDPNQKAQVELTLTANNSGGLNYTKIDNNVVLGPLDWIRASGSAVNPYPALNIGGKATNIVTINISMDQKLLTPSEARRSEKQAMAQVVAQPIRVENAQAQTTATPRVSSAKMAAAVEKSAASPIPQSVPADTIDEFSKVCADDDGITQNQVDYLAIKKLLIKTVEEQANDIYVGGPEISMNSLTLTTSIQLQATASMGTTQLLRIVPVVVPPTLSFNPDHTHQLKITLQGMKKKSLPSAQDDTIAACLARLHIEAGDNDGINYCRSARGKQLELLIEETQTKNATSTP